MADSATAEDYYELDPAHTDPKRMKKEREKAQKLRKSQWWLGLLGNRASAIIASASSPRAS